MHCGSMTTPETAAGRVYAILRANTGTWMDAWALQEQAALSTAISTRVSEIRAQLESDPERGEQIEHEQRGHRHYYRVVVQRRERQMELAI